MLLKQLTKTANIKAVENKSNSVPKDRTTTYTPKYRNVPFKIPISISGEAILTEKKYHDHGNTVSNNKKIIEFILYTQPELKNNIPVKYKGIKNIAETTIVMYDNLTIEIKYLLLNRKEFIFKDETNKILFKKLI